MAASGSALSSSALGYGLLGEGIGSLFGTSNPADAANPYFNQALSTLPQYFNQFINAGESQLNPLMQQYGNLMNNPGQMMNQIGAGYQQSPGYQFQLKQGLNAANQAAAAGGMGGTPMAQNNSAQFATGLANQDYYNYLSKALGLYSQGLQGSQGLANMGYGASTGLGEDLSSIYGSQAQSAYAGQQSQNQNLMGGIGGITAGLASIF